MNKDELEANLLKAIEMIPYPLESIDIFGILGNVMGVIQPELDKIYELNALNAEQEAFVSQLEMERDTPIHDNECSFCAFQRPVKIVSEVEAERDQAKEDHLRVRDECFAWMKTNHDISEKCDQLQARLNELEGKRE